MSLALTPSARLTHTHTTRASSTTVPKGCAGLVCSPECCRQRGTGPSLCSPWISMWFQATVQTRDIHRAFGSNMGHGHLHTALLLSGHRPRHGLQWQHKLEPPKPQVASKATPMTVPLHHRVARSTSLHSDPAVPLLFLSHPSTPYLHLTVTHAAGGSHTGQGLWAFNVCNNAKLPKKINLWPKLDTAC